MPGQVEEHAVVPIGKKDKADILVLSSSLLTDRMLRYSECIDVLSRQVDVRVWATSAPDPQTHEGWCKSQARVEEFPRIRAFREFPHNYLRRLNEYAWDFSLRPPSRLSMMRHVRDKRQGASIRILKLPARAMAWMKVEQTFENWLEKQLLNYSRSPEAASRLRAERPAAVVCTNPFWYTEPAVVAAAKKVGIPTLALIPSWDNLSTKSRMVFKYDGYLVWSEQARRELHSFYPSSREAPVYVVGAPQFDVFYQERFYRSREEFCAAHGLKSDRPIIVYALGSPNFLREHHGAVRMAARVAAGHLGDVQMIVRPHPIHDNAELGELFGRFAPRVALQRTGLAGAHVTARFQDERQITDWVNTFRHADVVINLSSTVTIDAALLDRPVINLDYDPEPGQPQQELIREINHLWTHFKPVAESGGVWLVDNDEELITAVRTYLRHPELHREKRRWIAEYVCGYTDGRSGERVANAIIDFTRWHASEGRRYRNQHYIEE
jgi:hypothetical protein